jgi:hypothetical protein
MKPFD